MNAVADVPIFEEAHLYDPKCECALCAAVAIGFSVAGLRQSADFCLEQIERAKTPRLKSHYGAAAVALGEAADAMVRYADCVEALRSEGALSESIAKREAAKDAARNAKA